ncbi:MAG: sulfate adenylyltransferase subunit CysD [Proteobacteria bacterium]|nr:sulfate adenylyltransferase subunit CysD [Pseudomonadota bacterium]
MTLPPEIRKNRRDSQGTLIPWDTPSVHELIRQTSPGQTLRATERTLESSGLLPHTRKLPDIRDEFDRPPKTQVVTSLDTEARRKRWLSLILQTHRSDEAGLVLFANDARLGRRWCYLDDIDDAAALFNALQSLAAGKNLVIWPHGEITARLRSLVADNGSHDFKLCTGKTLRIATLVYQETRHPVILPVLGEQARVERSERGESKDHDKAKPPQTNHLTHLDLLEASSIHIMREVMAQAENPVMLYSIGKDSSVMLHLAKKAFYPSAPPFPLLHVDTRWKFQAMYEFRDKVARESGMELIVHINPEGVAKNINPFDHGSALHTDIMKTEGLKQALDKYEFDVAFGGARRDEEKSRAKERVFSFRTASHRWDPKNQRPELWNLYNGYKTKGEGIRVFPLSNWTELDIWQYIYREQIPIVPLYYAAERPIVERDGMLMLVDDDRIKLFKGEKIHIKRVRFRTLGCYPLTGAVESDADDLPSIVLELLKSRTSERQGRAIDSDSSGSMEKKKQEGYF